MAETPNEKQNKRPTVQSNENKKKNWFSAAKGISCILRDHKINYKVNNSRQIVPILKKENPPEPVKCSYFLKTHFNIILPPTLIFFKVGSLLQNLAPPPRTHNHLYPPPHAMYPKQLINFDLISIT
jgi:hypothetical protein